MDSHIVGDVFILHNQRLYNPPKKWPTQPEASYFDKNWLRKTKKNLKISSYSHNHGNGEWPPLETKLILYRAPCSSISHFHDYGRKSNVQTIHFRFNHLFYFFIFSVNNKKVHLSKSKPSPPPKKKTWPKKQEVFLVWSPSKAFQVVCNHLNVSNLPSNHVLHDSSPKFPVHDQGEPTRSDQRILLHT